MRVASKSISLSLALIAYLPFVLGFNSAFTSLHNKSSPSTLPAMVSASTSAGTASLRNRKVVGAASGVSVSGSTTSTTAASSSTMLQASLKASSASDALEKRGGASQTALIYMAKVLPILAACTGAGIFLTAVLAPLTSPAAQGAKLVFAGAVAGIISRTCCAPIEMVSTVMMCRGHATGTMTEELIKTWKSEGVKGMFKGNGANCLKVAPSRGTQFLVYEFMKRQMVKFGFGIGAAASLNAGARLLAGGMAGMVAASIVYPLEVVKTMLTLYPEECDSIPGAIRTVFNNGGIPALYRGLGPTLVAMFPYVGVEFMVYETLKKRWEMTFGPVGTVVLLMLGALGGAAAQASAHPLDVIRRRMQMQSMGKDANTKDKKYNNMFTGLYRVTKDEGAQALFKGLGPACLEKIPSTAIGYFIYEAMKVALKVTSV